jgi:hypothetical protein
MPVRHPIDAPCHLHLIALQRRLAGDHGGRIAPGTRADAARGRGLLVVSGLALLAQPPRRLIAKYTATFGVTWRPVTRRSALTWSAVAIVALA